MLFSRPDIGGILQGYVPNREILRNPQMLYIEIEILAAPVMPHNLYLHSSILMGKFVNPRWLKSAAWAVAILIAGLNAWLLIQTVVNWIQ